MDERLQELLKRKPSKWGNVSVKTFEQDIKLITSWVKEQQKLTNKHAYENARVEDKIMAYAKKNGLLDYVDKWGNKPYSDEDHNIIVMLKELFDELDTRAT